MSIVQQFKALKLTDMTDAYPLITAEFNAAKERRRQELEAEIKAMGFKPGEARKSAVSAKFRGPNGESYSGRGAIPNWAKEAGVTTKEGMERFRTSS